MEAKTNFNDKLVMIAGKIQRNKYLQAITGALMATLGILMFASITLLLAVIPIDGYQSIITDTGIKQILLMPNNFATGALSLYVSFLVAYNLAKEFGKDGLLAGISGLFSFLMVSPVGSYAVGDSSVSALPLSWLGVQGLFTALIVSLVTTRIFIFVLEKNWTLKMPAGVPQNISNVFAGLFPAIISALVILIIGGIFKITMDTTVTEFIYSLLQIPLSRLGNSYWSLIILVFIQMIFWFLGLHGSNIVSPFITLLFLPLDLENLAAFEAGVALPNILGRQFYQLYAGIGGAGGTLGLCFLLAFFAKSAKMKAIGKLGVVPGLFVVNEPVVFGLPLMYNFTMVVPFILTPVIQLVVAYFATIAGLVPPASGVQMPGFGLPLGVSAFIQSGWRGAVLQIVLVVLSAAIYYPFFVKMDKEEYALETEAATVVE